ncbi:MAG TPA: hypothetical protein VLU73_07580 [Methylococcaceae bacterium]|jgi:hypothetical protein|nr:hypothetical protein [Methylococcaceae bacterium]
MAEAKSRQYSRPVFDQAVTIRSEQAQRVMAREFSRVVSALYAIDVILRIIGDDQEIDEVETVVNTLIGDCGKDVQSEKARLDKLREDNGITQLPRYTNPATTTVRIVSPQVAQFVALVQRMDDLMVTLDALWLCGILTNKQRSNGAYQWQQRLLRLGRRIVEIERRARVSAVKRGKEAEIRESMGEPASGEAEAAVSEGSDSRASEPEENSIAEILQSETSFSS